MDYDANMTSFREDLRALEWKILDVERKLNRQLKIGETTARQDVAAWLRSAKVLQRNMVVFEKKARKVKCFSRYFGGEAMVKNMVDLKKLLEASEFPHQLVEFRPEHEQVPTLPMKKESEGGNTFDRKVEEIWESLQNERVTKIGVHGMPGIGKTTALVRIKKSVQATPDLFDCAIWVDVSSDSSVSSLQDKIASKLNFSFLNERESRRVSGESVRAMMLHKKLIEKKRFVLILDDVWNVHTLSDVGIPSPTPDNGCKVVMTTRSLDVCNGMGMDKEIAIEPRPETEALELFKDKVGYRVCNRLSDDPMLASILEQIVRKCAGLPIAIVTTAGGLKDNIKLDDWKEALEDLRDLSYDFEPIKKLVQILRLSFDRLNDEGLKKCLLYCALFPEDHEIRIEFLVEHLIVEGIVERKTTRALETKTGREMVKRLQDVSLLNGSISNVGEKYVKMHDLIRDMALQIESETYKVQAGLKWESTKDENKWNGDLSKVSLANIRSATLLSAPPKTPKLSTLFLYQSNELDYIPDKFFRHMKGLSVLNLSFTAIVKLPESVSDLVSLTALFLRSCQSLRYVPSLAKLKKLTMLDFSGSGIKFVPEGLDVLPLLRYLNFNGCPLLIMPRRVLRKLINLQYLALPRPHKGPNANSDDLKLFDKLESFEGVLYDVNSFNSYVGTFGSKELKNYVLQVGFSDSYAHYAYDENHNKIVYLTGNLQGLASSSTEIRECLFLLPKDVNAVVVHHCHNNTGVLHDFTHVSDTSELRVCNVEECGGIEHLFSVSENELPLLPKLEKLSLDGVNDLCGLTKTERAFALCSDSFALLKELSICNCNNMKILFRFEVASFPNLEQLTLSRCEKLEAIGTNNTTMPRLTRFVLSKLPKLRKIPVTAEFLQEIHIEECPELREINPLLDSDHCSILLMHVYIDHVTWGSLGWECPNAKEFVMSRMNLADESDMEEAEPVKLAMSPTSLEEEEASALFRRSLDVIAALFQWEFTSLEEVSALFRSNFLTGSENRPNLFQKDFDEISAALFRRNLENEEKEEAAAFYRELELLCVSFHEEGMRVTASLQSKLQVEACFGRNLEVTSLFWSNDLVPERFTRTDFAQATVASALLRRNKQKLVLWRNNSEKIASYARNTPATPLSFNIGAAEAATVFQRKLNSFLSTLPDLLFIPRTGYYECAESEFLEFLQRQLSSLSTLSEGEAERE